MMNADQLADPLTALDRSRVRTHAAFVADPATLERPYAPGKWTGRRMLLHIVDSESAMFDRVRRLLAEEKPLLWAFDENRWDARLSFPGRSLATAQALYAAQRAAVRELVATIDEDEWGHTGVHNEAGRISVRDVVNKIVSHNLHHLEQVEAAIAGRTWTPAV